MLSRCYCSSQRWLLLLTLLPLIVSTVSCQSSALHLPPDPASRPPQPQVPIFASHYQWQYNMITSISTVMFPTASTILIQTLENELLYYTNTGTLIWSTPTTSLGNLIKCESSYAIFYATRSKKITYISLNQTNETQHVPLSQSTAENVASDRQIVDLSKIITSDTPTFRSSEKTLLVYDAFTLVTIPHGLESPPITSTIPQNYGILSAIIDPITHLPHVLLKYKKSQVCLASLESSTTIPTTSSKPANDQQTQSKSTIPQELQLGRCRQIAYNEKPIAFASVNGFILAQKSTSLLRMFFVNPQAEEIYRPRAKIIKIMTFENNDAVIFKYSSDFHFSSELCYLTRADLNCFGIEFKNAPIKFFPSSAGMLFLQRPETPSINSPLVFSFIHRESLESKTFAALTLSPMQLFASIHPVAKSNSYQYIINVLLETTEEQTIFAQVSSKTYKVLAIQETSLANSLPAHTFPMPSGNSLKSPYKLNYNPQTLATPTHEWSISNIYSAFMQRTRADINEIILPILQDPRAFLNGVVSNISWLTDLAVMTDAQRAATSMNQVDYQLDKLMVIITKSRKIFAMSSLTGEILYKQELPLPVAAAKDKTYSVHSVLSLPNQQELIAVLVHIPSNSTTLQYIAARSGKLIKSRSTHMKYNATETTSSFAPLKILLANLIVSEANHVLVVYESHAEIIPALSESKRIEANQKLDQSKIYFLKRITNSIQILRVQNIEQSMNDLERTSFVQLKHESTFQLPESQRLIAFTQNKVLESIEITGTQKLTGLIAVPSATKDTYRWLDFERRAFFVVSASESQIYVSLVDTVSNKVVMEKRIASVSMTMPIDVIFKSNVAYISFFSKYYNKQQLLSVRIIFKHFLTIFDLVREGKDLASSSLPVSSIDCQTKMYFSDVEIKKLHDIIEIDAEYLLLSSLENDLLFVNLNGIPENEHTLKAIDFKRINAQAIKGDSLNVLVSPTLLASRKTVLTTGHSVLGTAISPDGGFDRLPEHFDYDAVRISVCFMIILATLTVLVISCRSSRRQRRAALF